LWLLCRMKTFYFSCQVAVFTALHLGHFPENIEQRMESFSRAVQRIATSSVKVTLMKSIKGRREESSTRDDGKEKSEVPTSTDSKVNSSISGFLDDYKTALNEAVDKRPPSERLNERSKEIVVALCMSTTDREQHWPDLSMFSIMLPSLRQSLKQERNKDIEYRMYIAVDHESNMSSPERRKYILNVFHHTLQIPLLKEGVLIKVVLLSTLRNVWEKPGPSFNYVTQAAYSDGADYFYRMNDDTHFEDPWSMAAMQNLQEFSPPNLGVTGPIFNEGNTKILTHDITHRTHLNIFTTYYPVLLMDWGLDDWITTVYGSMRTKKGPFRIRHVTNAHPRSYVKDPNYAEVLTSELEVGRRTLALYLKKLQK